MTVDTSEHVYMMENMVELVLLCVVDSIWRSRAPLPHADER